ncbi:MAG: hypothetical protein JXR76_09545 [Deltaproteobacteria bacterium]|nr:hypothetical protein [Deltaproteobacteria bacterium]
MVKNHPDTVTMNEQKNLRRLYLLRKSGLFHRIPTEIRCKQATNVAEYRSAYQLVYQSYLEKAYILPNTAQMRIRPWETSPTTGTFICKKSGEVIGVTSTIMDSEDLGLPSDIAFHPELSGMRDEGAILCEISNQAIATAFRNSAVVTELMQAAYGHAWFMEASDLVCAVSPKQRKFFELIGFEQVGETKSYSDVIFDPVILLRLRDIQTRYADTASESRELNTFWNNFFIMLNPYIPIYPLWQRMVNSLFSSDAQLSGLFEGCTDVFANADHRAQAAVKRNLGSVYTKMMTAENTTAQTN